MIDHYVNETCYYFPSVIDFADRFHYSYKWSFDDFTFAEGYKVSHIWKHQGDHIITLTVTNLSNNYSSVYKITQRIGLPGIV